MGNIVVVSIRRLRPKLRKSFHVVMLGLDSSGKTAILYRSKFKENVTKKCQPTTAFNVETVRPSKGLRFKIWDVSGREQKRPLWKAYARQTDAIIFVVDSANEDRIEEAKEELFNLVNSAQINGAPILIFANKQDLPNAVAPMEVISKLSLPHLNSKHLWYLQPTSAVCGDGIVEGLRVLSDMINQWKTDIKDLKSGRRKRKLPSSRTNSINNII